MREWGSEWAEKAPRARRRTTVQPAPRRSSPPGNRRATELTPGTTTYLHSKLSSATDCRCFLCWGNGGCWYLLLASRQGALTERSELKAIPPKRELFCLHCMRHVKTILSSFVVFGYPVREASDISRLYRLISFYNLATWLTETHGIRSQGLECCHLLSSATCSPLLPVPLCLFKN